MTNSVNIYSNCDFNSKFYSLSISNYLVNYNKVKTIDNKYMVGLINLANLNYNLMEKINESNLEKLLIINCHHQDFWKKIKLLTNFNIDSRKQFVCNQLKYFITVTVLFRIKN